MMRWIRSETGNVAVEFALLAPVIALLLAGLSDYGEAVDIRTELSMAARAGVQYAMHYPTDSAGLTWVVQNATKNPSANFTVTDLTATPSRGSQPNYCTCGSGDPSLANQVDCNTGTCTSPAVMKVYVAVTVTETYTPVLPYNGRFTAFTLANTATFEVQ